jgi:pyrroloquinoline-quinone synthase
MDAPTSLIGPYRLLDHPFYRRWEAGELSRAELAAYAAQYRHFEAMLPGFLAELSAGLEGPAAELVAANLADEVGGATSHLELFDAFAAAVGAPSAEPASPAMARLLDVYAGSLRDQSGARALGVLAGYEVQAAEVAVTKGDGLAARYGLGEDGCAFWRLHAELEGAHAAWTLEAAGLHGGELDAHGFAAGAAESAAAWWSFLDEREALAAA